VRELRRRARELDSERRGPVAVGDGLWVHLKRDGALEVWARQPEPEERLAAVDADGVQLPEPVTTATKPKSAAARRVTKLFGTKEGAK
jgi:hypothetical protein